ncbi:MAG: hypothetical protein KBT36_10735 [Kurthia sp.]|nr:hypothetical protein [Candidatus Kurthia equi]
MENQMKDFLLKHKNKKINLLQLERAVPSIEYEPFAELILSLEKQKVLQRIHKSGMNSKNPTLAYRYIINKDKILQDIKAVILLAKKNFHPSIELDIYLNKSIEKWQIDLSYLKKLNTYIKTYGFPTKRALAHERSYEIFQDANYITEGGGRTLLENTKVWNKLLIWPVNNPVSFGVNMQALSNDTHLHLIVENKDTYYSLLPVLQNSQFTTLLYGEGKSIISTIDIFPQQLPLPNATHKFFYFGDLDYMGIEIWYLLRQKIEIQPAVPLYDAFSHHHMTIGKTYQRKNEVAMSEFLTYFSPQQQSSITELFKNGGYYPPGILKTEDLQNIMNKGKWGI